jgi:ABC transporter substrate binding protein
LDGIENACSADMTSPGIFGESDIDRLFAWARYLYWCDLNRQRLDSYDGGAEAVAPEWPRRWFFIALLAQWYASLWVVMEGWRETTLSDLEVAQAVARPIGVTVQPVEIRTPADIEPAFSAVTQNRLQAICLTSDGLIYVEQERLAQLALSRSLPLIGYTREMAKWTGMLMTYGANNVALFKRAAYFVDRILKGTEPGDLPVEQPTKIELVINLSTAKTLGLTIPQTLLLRADEIIQ